MLIRLIIFSLFCFFLTFIPVNFLKLNYFNLTKITISENSKILHRELTNLTKNLYNKNNFDIDYKELKKIFKKDIRVEDVEI
ncbi:MAG: cell division protein FtsQ, partial [Fusobacterium sp.]|nr:cell division protein FtsQ [Fusobacterium sp.]